MAVRKIVYFPHRALRTPAVDMPLGWEEDNGAQEEVVAFCQDLEDTMTKYGGIGISAPQVGQSLSIFLISGDIDPDCAEPTRVYINPRVTKRSKDTVKDKEGCLSFPNIFLEVNRNSEVEVEALDREGRVFRVAATGLLARAIQHELDHLTGKLMVDFFGQLKKEMIKKKMIKWKKKYGLD